MKKISNLFAKFLIWITYYKITLGYEDMKEGRCLKCDANGNDCIITFPCPCKPNEQLKVRPYVKFYYQDRSCT